MTQSHLLHGSVYAAPGTYWDSAGGCLRGSWVSGNLKGQGQYDQPHYHFEGQFAKGLPAGARGPLTHTPAHCCAVHLPNGPCGCFPAEPTIRYGQGLPLWRSIRTHLALSQPVCCVCLPHRALQLQHVQRLQGVGPASGCCELHHRTPRAHTHGAGQVRAATR